MLGSDKHAKQMKNKLDLKLETQCTVCCQLIRGVEMKSVKCVWMACTGMKGVGHRKVALVVGQGDNWFGR